MYPNMLDQNPCETILRQCLLHDTTLYNNNKERKVWHIWQKFVCKCMRNRLKGNFFG